MGGGTDRGDLRQIGPGNWDATLTPATISFRGLSIPIVRRRDVILRKGQGEDCRFPDPNRELAYPAMLVTKPAGTRRMTADLSTSALDKGSTEDRAWADQRTLSDI